MPDPLPSADPPPPPDLTGRTLGDFQVLRKIGQGGMGQVYLARQLSLKREVALKILRDDHAANPTALKRFQAEAEAVARISHPNIVQVYAVGEVDGLRHMALEYVNGRNLKEFLDRKGPPELPVALHVLRQVAAALQRAAELGLVHRDIKPENILITRKAEVKVTDFGLSRYVAGEGQPLSLTRSGMTLGTPLYMSPEQVQGRAVDHRSDLYSFGVTAYHLLAGFPPFRGTTAFEVAAQHVQREAEPLADVRPDLPPDLCAVVHRLMAKNPDERYQSSKDVIRDLGKIQKGVSLATTGVQPATAPPPPLSISLSGTALTGVGATTGGQVPLNGSVPVSPARWRWRVIGAAVVVLAAGGGWWAYSLANPAANGMSTTGSPGLPDTRPPTPLVSAREAVLVEQRKSTPPTDRKHLEAGMQLGLLYVAERRLDDADKVFKELGADPPKPKDQPLPVPVTALSLFGQAIVLAHDDKPDESNAAFVRAIGLVKQAERNAAVQRLCFEYPAFGQAIAEAVNRNADSLPPDGKLPPLVEWLRNPSSLLRGPK